VEIKNNRLWSHESQKGALVTWPSERSQSEKGSVSDSSSRDRKTTGGDQGLGEGRDKGEAWRTFRAMMTFCVVL
jgi:hypothetical protein